MQFFLEFVTIIGLWWRFFGLALSVYCLLLQHQMRRAMVTPSQLQQHQFLAFHCYFGHSKKIDLTRDREKKKEIYMVFEHTWISLASNIDLFIKVKEDKKKKIFTRTKHSIHICLTETNLFRRTHANNTYSLKYIQFAISFLFFH